MPPVLPPPLFGLPSAGGAPAAKPPRGSASEYTMVMQAQVKPVDAPVVAKEPVADATPSHVPRRLTLPVILMINAVLLLTIALILYFVMRAPPPAVPTAAGAKAAADSAVPPARTDSAGPPAAPR